MKRHGLFAALFAAAVLLAGAAFGLDVTDVKNLVRNNVDEATIINLAQQGGNFSVTSNDLAELRGLGASETLISSLFTAPPMAAVPPTVYYEAPDGTLTTTAPAPTVVYQTVPQVVTPTYVYPYPYPRRHYFRSRPGVSFSLNFGNRPRYRSYRRWR